MKEEIEIKFTDETKEIFQNYLKKRQSVRVKRETERQNNRESRNKIVEKAVKVNLINPYQEHIDKLEVIKVLLNENQTYNGDSIVVKNADQRRAQSAARYVETAISMLNTITKIPK